MPAELLHDVVWTGTSTRARRLTVLPVSFAAHVAAALVFLMIPLAAEVEPPAPAPMARPDYILARPVPAPPPPAASPAGSKAQVQPATGAPIAAPPAILPERERPEAVTAPPGMGVIGGLGSEMGTPGGLGLGLAIEPPAPPPRIEPPPAPRRPGGDIREPRKLVHVTPVYPELARAGRVEGIVILEAVVNVRGEVERVRALRSKPLLEQAAIDAVRRWRYTPTLLNGTPVPILLTITVTFRIND